MRKNYSTNTPWEGLVGYSRAVQVGQHIHVSGTTATNREGKIVEANDPYLQTVQIITNIESALKAFNANLKDVIRTRIYVANMDHWEQIAKAHHEFFGEVRPAATIVEVSRFISPEILIEIEADAFIGCLEL